MYMHNTYCIATQYSLDTLYGHCFIQMVPVKENSLPVVLPVDVALKGKGLSPLAGIQEWQQASCGK